MVDDDKKFAVSLDVSQFRPEELNVHVEGRELTIEGKQEHRNDSSFMQRWVEFLNHAGVAMILRFYRSFIRKWTLPEGVNLEALHTQLSDKGHLCVEAPKNTDQAAQRRNIPIMAAKSSK